MIKKISTEEIHENPYFKYLKDDFELEDGQKGNYYYCTTLGGAMIIPVLEDGRLALVRQHRYLADKHSIEFPCGGVDGDESAHQTAARELLEETGYTSSELIKVSEFEAAPGRFIDKCSVYVATDLKQIQEPTPEITSPIEVLVRRVDEFEEMIKRGEIWDGYTLAAWAIARDYISNL
jgi:ADP-ribose pyrophosphatase